MLFPTDIKEAVNLYLSYGFRPMPLFGIDQQCKHKPIKPELDCKGQCWGKVPMVEHWPNVDNFEFPEGCNIALIMGKQRNNKWLVGFDIDGVLDLSEFMFLPPTLECTTNRGKHLIYEVEADSALGNWNDILNLRNETGYRLNYQGALDIRYCRGAMVSPPSFTKNLTRYEWINFQMPTLLPSSEIIYLKRKRKFQFPHIKRYSKWSLDPLHFNKKP